MCYLFIMFYFYQYWSIKDEYIYLACEPHDLYYRAYEMSHIARSVCVSVNMCLLITTVSPAKTA